MLFCLGFMSINGQNVFNTGAGTRVGIGTVTPALDFLDMQVGGIWVANGDINLNTTTRSYMIAQQPVLWYNNDASNIYVGVGAGDAAATTAFENTFIGNNAGTAITTGDGNTFVGQGAGSSNNTGEHNVFIGENAGPATTTGLQNVFVGASAGLGNVNGNRNTAIGEWSAMGAANLDYATAIGCRAIVTQSNSLVLGAVENENGAPFNTNVGIGTTAPSSVLHLARNTNVPVLTLYTNPNTFNGTTLDGFEVGVNGNGDGIIRHLVDASIEISTDNTPRAIFTNTDFFGAPGTPGTLGAGLRIYDPNSNGGDLDLWTSTSNQSHIVWGPNGRIQGVNDRFEIQADFTNGLWFNVVNPFTGTFFNQGGQETGRIGANTFWRIGANTTPGADAARRLEIVDGTDPQLRLTNSLTPLRITDFLPWLVLSPTTKL
jgi:hypothetical protein